MQSERPQKLAFCIDPSKSSHTIRATYNQISAARIDASIELAEATDDDAILRCN